MGQDFCAIADCGFDLPRLRELPACLNARMPALEECMHAARLKELGDPLAAEITSWRWQTGGRNLCEAAPDVEGGTLDLEGPGSLSLHVGPHASIVSCWVRWSEFLTDAQVRDALRAILGGLTQCFASRVAIYLPDSGWGPGIKALNAVYSGADFRLIREQLQRECGPPAPDIPKIYVRKEVVIAGKSYQCFSGEGYFVERFDA